MAELSGNLWEWNLAKVVIVDVSTDYQYMLGPMPSEFYPVLKEVWLPRHQLSKFVQSDDLVGGYLYDWHERSEDADGNWYVGVVKQELAKALLEEFGEKDRPN